MGITLGLVLASMLLVAIEAWDCWRHLMFWPSQVIKRWGRPGIAFFAHGGMWGDFLFLPFLFAYVITQFGREWTTQQMMQMGMVGFAFSVANHILCINGVIPDPIGWKKEKWSLTIALHFLYMSVYIALVGMFFFYSPGKSFEAVVVISILLGLHTMAGTHVFLGVLNRFVQWNWCPDFLAWAILPYFQAGIWALLSGLAWYAAGFQAGLSVATAGAILGTIVVTIATFGPQIQPR